MQRRRAGRASRIATIGVAAFGLGLTAPDALAEDERFDVGLRYVVISAGGEPTNDQMGAGLVGRYRLNDDWLLGVTIDRMSGDFERPYELFGNTSPEELDSTVDSTVISALIEREYGDSDRKLRWFWSAALGFTSPDVDDVAGPLTGGGTFDIATDAGSETLVGVAGGLRRSFWRGLALEVGVRADRHLADWELIDRDNATTAAIDDYTTWGVNLGLRFAF